MNIDRNFFLEKLKSVCNTIQLHLVIEIQKIQRNVSLTQEYLYMKQ